MTFMTNELIEDLKNRTAQNKADLIKLVSLSSEDLNKRAQPESWSALECIAHLNIYGEFYIPEIRKNIKNSKFRSSDPQFKSGWMGNYFVKMVGPLEGSKKMKTLSSTNTLGSDLDRSTLNIFSNQLEDLLQLLKDSNSVSLNKTKTGISIAPWIKIKLGDALRVVILHNQRHMEQALRAVS